MRFVTFACDPVHTGTGVIWTSSVLVDLKAVSAIHVSKDDVLTLNISGAPLIVYATLADIAETWRRVKEGFE
jgi:hypothetical protein